MSRLYNSQLTTFKLMFVQMDLPNSAYKDEILQLKVIVFNYLPNKQDVSISCIYNVVATVRAPNPEHANLAIVYISLYNL